MDGILFFFFIHFLLLRSNNDQLKYTFNITTNTISFYCKQTNQNSHFLFEWITAHIWECILNLPRFGRKSIELVIICENDIS